MLRFDVQFIGTKGFGLAFVTAASFTCAFVLKIPAIGDNLAVGSLAAAAGTVALMPIVGAIYATDGVSTKLVERIKEIYFQRWAGVPVYAIGNLILMVILSLWIFTKF